MESRFFHTQPLRLAASGFEAPVLKRCQRPNLRKKIRPSGCCSYLTTGAPPEPPAFPQPAAPPEMEWIARPTRGWLAGTVRDAGGAADGAAVTVKRVRWFARRRRTRTDGNGFFGFTELPPGRYRVRLEARPRRSPGNRARNCGGTRGTGRARPPVATPCCKFPGGAEFLSFLRVTRRCKLKGPTALRIQALPPGLLGRGSDSCLTSRTPQEHNFSMSPSVRTLSAVPSLSGQEEKCVRL